MRAAPSKGIVNVSGFRATPAPDVGTRPSTRRGEKGLRGARGSVCHPTCPAVDGTVVRIRYGDNAAASDLEVAGQVDDVVEEVLQRGRLNQGGPAQQGGVLRHPLAGDPAELAQVKATADHCSVWRSSSHTDA